MEKKNFLARRYGKGGLLSDTFGLLSYWQKVRRAPAPDHPFTVHQYGKHRHQYFLRILPNGVPTPQKIVFIHGGGWQFGNAHMFLKHGQRLAAWGFETFVLTHRKLPFYHGLHLLDDINQAATHIQHNFCCSQNDAFILGGMSSGGHLAALLALHKQSTLAANRVQRLFLLSAPLNLQKMRPSPTVMLLTNWQKRELRKHLNPFEQIPSDFDCPTLIVHGNRDFLVEYTSATSFVERFEQTNSALTRFITIKGGGHLAAANWAHQDDQIAKQLRMFITETTNC